MRIDYKQAAEFIKNCDNVLILAHSSPDGDTVGSSFALCRALRNLGKRVNVSCADEIPEKYDYITDWCAPQIFDVETVIACDVAGVHLLGENNAVRYGERVDLCIDHHISNTDYARRLLLGEHSASACEVVYTLLVTADIPVDRMTAQCIYTGMATDTGCFRFENVTSETHRIASVLYTYDIPFGEINRHLFDIKSKARLKTEQIVMSQPEFYCGGKCAVIAITADIIEREGLGEGELEGIPALPMQIEGVEIGITIKEKDRGVFKVSVRTASVDASAICANFGGGGHIRAAGCKFSGTYLEDVKRKMAAAAAEALEYDGQ